MEDSLKHGVSGRVSVPSATRRAHAASAHPAAPCFKLSSNPAVASLFREVNPFLRLELERALAAGAGLNAEELPEELLVPLFVLNCVALDLGAEPLVINSARLRELTAATEPEGAAGSLLDGATLNLTPPRYPERATMNCLPGEVMLEYLPDGARFRCGGRIGQLVYRTPSRAVVDWEGAAKERRFTDKHGDQVIITASGAQRTGCALSAPVLPIYKTVTAAERDTATNAYKELTGVYNGD